MIVNDNSTVVNKLETSLFDDARVVIYYRHMFIVQATEWLPPMCKHSHIKCTYPKIAKCINRCRDIFSTDTFSTDTF